MSARKFISFGYLPLAAMILVMQVIAGQAQTVYPAQVNVNLIPPYSLYLNDYATGMRERISVTVFNRDMQNPNMTLKLSLTIKASGFTLKTNSYTPIPAIIAEPNVPYRLSQQEIANYFNPQNLTASGMGTSAWQREQKLPEGLIQFCFEAFDYNTGRKLSLPGCGMALINTQKPPLLNLPFNGVTLTWKEPLNQLFQWAPHHSGLSHVEYELIIKQLWDDAIRPEAAWAYSTEILREPLRPTSFLYGVTAPPLTPGMRYAWAVRAIAYDGMDELRVFENSGLSEIRWFRVEDYCPQPVDLKVESKNGKIYLTWIPPIEQREVTVSYRQTDPVPHNGEFEADWFHSTTTGDNIVLYDVRPGATYEYRVAATCRPGFPVYGPTRSITVPPLDTANPNCGEMPEIDLSNQERLLTLNPGEMFFAGDFPVYAMEVTGSGDGVFNGTGYMLMSRIFGHAKLRVKLVDVVINTDMRLIDGWVDGVYDEAMSQIANLDTQNNGSDGIRIDITVNFVIPYNPEFEYNPNTGVLVIYDSSSVPQSVELPKNDEGKTVFPATIKDADGNVYKVSEKTYVDADGKEQKKVTMEETEEDKSISMVERDFLYSLHSNGNDSIFHNNTLDVHIDQIDDLVLTANYKMKELVNSFGNIAGLNKLSNIKVNSNWNDSIKMDIVFWEQRKQGSSKVETGTGWTFMPAITDAGNYTITIDATSALNIIYSYEKQNGTRSDTLIRGRDINLNRDNRNLAKIVIHLNVFDVGKLLFKPNSENYYTNYGFDDAMQIECQQSKDINGNPDYEKLSINGADYYVPWLGIIPNTDAEIKLNYIANDISPNSNSKIVLKCDNNALFIDGKRSINQYNLFDTKNIILKTENAGDYDINAYLINQTGQETLIGKLKVESKNLKKTKKIRIIHVKRKDENSFPVINKEQLVSDINKYYKQAFNQFELDNKKYIDTLTIIKTKNDLINVQYFKDSINWQFRDNDNEENYNIHYIFVLNNKGINTNNGQANTPYDNSMEKVSVVLGAMHPNVAAHELGHNLGLQHTFESRPNIHTYPYILSHKNRILINRGTTKNIMDYGLTNENIRRYFFKYQIEHLKE